jgi:hypothetical protein
MKHNLSELYASNPLKACQLALRRTVDSKDRLEAINELLGLYGTEAIRGEWQNGYWCDIVAAYCNTGDTYALTVIELRGDGFSRSSSFLISTIGDFVERNQEKYGIE